MSDEARKKHHAALHSLFLLLKEDRPKARVRFKYWWVANTGERMKEVAQGELQIVTPEYVCLYARNRRGGYETITYRFTAIVSDSIEVVPPPEPET